MAGSLTVIKKCGSIVLALNLHKECVGYDNYAVTHENVTYHILCLEEVTKGHTN